MRNTPAPGSPLDPLVQREFDIADVMRSEELQNDFMRQHEAVLHTAPDAFYGLTGRAALDAAPEVEARLRRVRDDLLGQTTNARQRHILGEDLDAHMEVVGHDIARHVSRQALVWEQGVARDRLDLLKQKAKRDWDNPDRLKIYGDASESAARTIARSSGFAVESERATGEAARARSALYRAAVGAALAEGAHEHAVDLHGRFKNHFIDEDAASLDPVIAIAREMQVAKIYVSGIAPAHSPSTVAEADAAHAAATHRNRADWAKDDSQFAANQHLIDVLFGRHARSLEQADAEQESPSRKLPFWPGINDAGPSARLLSGLASPDEAERIEPPSVSEQSGQGIAANVEPPPGSAEFQAANAGVRDAGSPPATSPKAIATVMGPVADATTRVVTEAGRVAAAATRIAPVAAAFPAVAAAAPILLIPGNTGADTIDLDDGLRARLRPGQATVAIERRVSKGILGTGVAAQWEPLIVKAEISIGPSGHRVIAVHPGELAEAVGEETAKRVFGSPTISALHDPAVPPVPAVEEIRIGVLGDDRKAVTTREVTVEEAAELCPNYPTYWRIGVQASQRVAATGLENGPKYGVRVHNEAKIAIESPDIQKALKQHGVVAVEPEIALLRGVPKSYSKGYSRLDVVELDPRRRTVCVYDFKTGGATFRDKTMDRYGSEVHQYVNKLTRDAAAAGYDKVYLIPVHVP